MTTSEEMYKANAKLYLTIQKFMITNYIKRVKEFSKNMPDGFYQEWVEHVKSKL